MTTLDSGTCLGGRYRVERLIGVGGMGVVYRARDERCSGNPVALKLIGAHLANNDLDVQRFKREAQLSVRLRHPNIVAGLGSGYDTSLCRHFMALELVDGEDVCGLLRRRRLMVNEVVELVGQVCAALTYSHSCGVVHGDVSPGNILVGNDRATVKLTDFGIARTGWTARRVSQVDPSGAPDYLAPEVAAGAAATPRSDLYALAATARRLLVGERKWLEPSWGDPNTAPRLADACPEVPSRIARAIDTATEADPDARQHSVAAFDHELAGRRPGATDRPAYGATGIPSGA